MQVMQLKVLQKTTNGDSYFSLVFEKPAGFIYCPGQYLDSELPVKDPNGNTRAFTISASPTEDFLMLSTNYGSTPFKKALAKLKSGHKITASHPAGTFILDESSPAVLIAGGVGITPFRSMIKYAIENNIKTPITLLYSNSDENFLFKKELEECRKLLPKLTIIYHNSTQNGRLNLDSRFLILDSIYYLAGPPSFVDDFGKILLELGVDETNIRYDRFDGY